MESNKEEAFRAKGIAENKMQNRDFVGARKMALKALQLCPDLENISQMITVCDVHCSSEQTIFGSEMHWYSILQIEQTADEASIKKQYRKLALLLHPDKNKFAGAEAAFKLIGEAHRVLSDQAKRTLYDMKHRVPLRNAASKQPSQQPTFNSYVWKQSGVQNNNDSTSQFTSLNPHRQQRQKTQPGFTNGGQTFWTICPFCRTRYLYDRDMVNKALRCQSCKKPYVAYDRDAKGEPSGTNWSQPAFPQQKEVPNKAAQKVEPQSTVGSPPTSMGNFSHGNTSSDPFPKMGSISEVGPQSKTNRNEDGKVDMEGEKMLMFEGKTELKPSGSRRRKRGRKSLVEASDSCDTGSSTDTEEDGVLPAGQSSGFTAGQRSNWQKQNGASNENASDDDDFVSPQKRSRGGLSGVTEEEGAEASFKGEGSKTDKPVGFAAVLEEEKIEVKQKGRAPLEASVPNGNDEAMEFEANEKEAATVDDDKEKSNVVDDSKSSSSPKTTTDPEYYVYSDPEFSDFNKDRKEECFAVGQMWAGYDTADAMPRFYARIRKVFSPGFKLQVTWLEPDPDDQDEIDWLNKELPIACGKFRHGSSENIEDRLMFSHLVNWKKGSNRCSYKIYPRKGETWALFKNWDIKWNFDPDNPRQREFEFVEALSEYVEGVGINVVYLSKMKGFVSLFRQMTNEGMVSFQISPSELLRFSHRVPSFRMTGMEREDVPKGSFELDPASLPTNLEEFAHPEDEKVDIESINAKVNDSADSEYYVYSDPEFSNFDKDRKEECFAVGQMWAGYDTADAMPRFYARIRKVFSPGFKLQVTWLEPDPDDQDEIDWLNKELPIACGKFRHGSSENIEDRLMFSHLVNWKKGSNRCSYKIYPRKGETWALFKNWDIKWNFDPDIPRQREFEFVEALSEYVEGVGINVTYLGRMKGFVCLFQQMTNEGKASFQIPPSELLRFSHRVPSFKMTGMEREDVPKGSFELDPASLPTNLEEFTHPEDEKVDTESINAKVNDSADSEYYVYSDPEFSDFDKDREEECFAVGQMWAVYDTVDAMPRFYARIRKVFSPGFKLQVTWLEPDPDDQDKINWLNKELPIACGKFRHGSSENIEDRLMFSHLVNWKKGSNRCSYKIYPRKGETWALFKNWDIKWNFDPDIPRQREFEFVEALSEYVEGVGISVTYLGKMKGFVCLFQQMTNEGKASFQIPPSELLRFSHRVPSFRMTGMEREDVPKGSFEFDPASLPTNLEAFAHPEDEKVDTESINAKVNDSADLEYYVYSDPEFSDFDKDRKGECFAVGQMWAVYDTVDAMPRFYARIRKVFSPGFKLQVTWLEPDPDDQDKINWLNEKLPIACGKFRNESSENIEDRLMFSHLVYWKQGSNRCSYMIYPRKGETWAIFKNWDIKWNFDPDNHRQCEFEFVETLSEYVEGVGINVVYLGKMKGFVSLFRQMTKEGMVPFQIPPSELLRFSHRVPSFRMTGMEREDVPKGSFELDPASLPTNLKEFAHPEDEKVNTESVNAKVNDLGSKSLEDEVKPMMGFKRPNTPKKSIDQDDRNTLERGDLKSENRSLRELNGSYKMPGLANSSQCAAKEEGDKHLDVIKDSSRDFTQAGGSASTYQADEKERHLDAMDTSSDSVNEDVSPGPALSPEAYEIPKAEFYDFDSDKSPEKFQPGQIWALYSDEDGLPKYYARIKTIESRTEFKLHITWLDACSPPKDMIQWLDKDMPICCGTFMLRSGKSKDYSATTSFSHQLRAEPAGQNKYAIYPRKGEIWALYQNWNAEWTFSDLENCKFDIVQILEDNDLGKKVLVLIRLEGFKSVFKAQREVESVVTMEIPCVELLRFSHQIPAFLLTQERDGQLRGCWELDPASMPYHLFCSD